MQLNTSYGYSPLGYLTSVTGGGSNGFSETVSYQVLAMNPQGQITQYRYGNQITTVKDIDPINQRLKGQAATKDGQGSGNVLNQSYRYDALGNLLRRSDDSPGVGTQENFSYDMLNRLEQATMVGGAVSPSIVQVQYDPRGNISYKSDVGLYWYDAARPNRMTNITLASAPDSQPLSGTRVLTYAFDDHKPTAQTVNGVQVGNGNLWYTVSQDSVNGKHNVRWEDYTSFNMPAQIRFGSLLDINDPTNTVADRTLSFVYGPEHQRIKQNVTLTGNGTSSYFAGNTWYLNGEDSLGLSYEKEVRANGTVQEKHYVSAGGVTFALFTRSSGQLNGLPATSTSYFHHDQLGSISAITNEAGVVQERLAYDPWGKRRFINSTPGLPDPLDAIVGVNTERGFTMHEHLDEIGVIHMNGRIYDPLIGRFMSADPFIQAPGNLQSYNRYAYVMNNPLAMTDPSGYNWLEDRLNELWESPVVQVFVTVVITVEAGPVAAAAYNGARTWHDTGSLEQGLEAAAISYGTSKAFIAVGGQDLGAGTAPNIAAHAAVGCVSSVASGGSCQSGALAAGFSEFAAPRVSGSFEWRVAQIAIIGGTASVLGGGKFENGATTAAFGYLYNFLGSHPGSAKAAYMQAEYGVDGFSSDCGCNRLTTSISNAIARFTTWVGNAYDQLVFNGADSAASDSERKTNPSKQDSPVWGDLDNAGNGVKTSGNGSKQRYYEWDHTHNDIEVYDKKGRHLGSMDPTTGELYKPPVNGRKLER